ncbi:Chromosome partition protein Smc OS=Streptomyces antimycoticus OX=68175 GN=SANT12839_101680 PE=4 SV=1 [Streptomyces antimycoticus]
MRSKLSEVEETVERLPTASTPSCPSWKRPKNRWAEPRRPGGGLRCRRRRRAGIPPSGRAGRRARRARCRRQSTSTPTPAPSSPPRPGGRRGSRSTSTDSAGLAARCPGDSHRTALTGSGRTGAPSRTVLRAAKVLATTAADRPGPEGSRARLQDGRPQSAAGPRPHRTAQAEGRGGPPETRGGRQRAHTIRQDHRRRRTGRHQAPGHGCAAASPRPSAARICLPVWFETALGPLPPHRNPNTWMETATDLLAYRVAYGSPIPSCRSASCPRTRYRGAATSTKNSPANSNAGPRRRATVPWRKQWLRPLRRCARTWDSKVRRTFRGTGVCHRSTRPRGRPKPRRPGAPPALSMHPLTIPIWSGT